MRPWWHVASLVSGTLVVAVCIPEVIFGSRYIRGCWVRRRISSYGIEIGAPHRLSGHPGPRARDEVVGNSVRGWSANRK